MATLSAWRFETPDGVEAATRTLQALAREHVVVLHDAATVTWEAGRTKPTTRQLASTTGADALGGSFWGLLFGLVFFAPLLGEAIGTPTGVLAGSLSGVGIDERFVEEVRAQVTPGTSALFLMTPDAVTERVREAFARQQPARVISTHLDSEQEAALREVFAE